MLCRLPLPCVIHRRAPVGWCALVCRRPLKLVASPATLLCQIVASGSPFPTGLVRQAESLPYHSGPRRHSSHTEAQRHAQRHGIFSVPWLVIQVETTCASSITQRQRRPGTVQSSLEVLGEEGIQRRRTEQGQHRRRVLGRNISHPQGCD